MRGCVWRNAVVVVVVVGEGYARAGGYPEKRRPLETEQNLRRSCCLRARIHGDTPTPASRPPLLCRRAYVNVNRDRGPASVSSAPARPLPEMISRRHGTVLTSAARGNAYRDVLPCARVPAATRDRGGGGDDDDQNRSTGSVLDGPSSSRAHSRVSAGSPTWNTRSSLPGFHRRPFRYRGIILS
ncbi:Hypothetical protein CINCED_3A011394 [Cinara cedri]|uniref:Secreted protein n=1 Tax=Cinara cedri TaxID=506608 RepID=A0A5E4N2S2_9HEMI|nr:Hypothetical protein CINCED_3A011394 [Cinara cedri]